MTTSTVARSSALPAEHVATAAARAGELGRPVLASVVEQIPAVDPLSALQAAGAWAAGTCMYWTKPADSFALATIGSVMTFTPAGAGRFAEVEAAWGALVEDAVIDDPSGGLDGVGPVLAGGFSFDPDGSTAAHWRDFPAALMSVPRLQVTASGGRHWLTTTVRIAPDGSSDMEQAELAVLREAALGPAHTAPPAADDSLRFADDGPPGAWQERVAKAVRAIRHGSLEKVVLARARLASAGGAIDVHEVLRHLRSAYPECYVFGCWSGTSAFVGASPERLVRLDGREVRASSLAGSAPRGATRAEDAALAAGLLASAKDRAEHAMVRDALDVGLAALCSEVDAPRAPSLFTLPHVHHLHTAVRARLRPGRSLLDLVAALHPTPAVGGAPRDTALRFIRGEESLDRGWYAGPIGWVGRQRGEFAVALRSGLIRADAAWLYAGCGIVAGSDPAAEYAETLLKLRPMESALAASFAPAPR